jgi:hypothetical protein
LNAGSREQALYGWKAAWKWSGKIKVGVTVEVIRVVAEELPAELEEAVTGKPVTLSWHWTAEPPPPY